MGCGYDMGFGWYGLVKVVYFLLGSWIFSLIFWVTHRHVMEHKIKKK